MLELFLALAWYQMIGMIILPVVFLFTVFNDEITGSLIFLALTIGLLHYFTFIDLTSLDILKCFYSVVIYLILGSIWSLFKYKQKAKEITTQHIRDKTNSKEYILKRIKLSIRNSEISYWIIFFPISMIKFALSDFVDYLISKLGRIYDYIARYVVDSVFKDDEDKSKGN